MKQQNSQTGLSGNFWMNATLRLMTMVLIFLSPPALCENSRNVHSLDQLPGAFKSNEGLAKFREQMSGVPLPDGFGTSLPAGLSVKAIVELIAPEKDTSLATLVGVKSWPYQANSFVAIVCLASNKKEYEDDMRYNNQRPSCEAPSGEFVDSYKPKEVYLAMLEYRENEATPKLIASYGKPLDIKTNWEHTNLEGPYAENNGIFPYTYSRFDFAPFKISEKETAFGIRVGWSVGYAGGGGDFQALMLFIVNGDRVLNILSEPIYYSKNIAGDWHKDGTRDHELYEGENTVIMLSHKAHGYYDLQLKNSGEKWKQVFVWSNKDSRYQPVQLKPASGNKH